MSIQIISISHKNAPLHVREKFAYSTEQQIHMMQTLTSRPEISECIVLSTCNRTEMYAYSESLATGQIFEMMEDTLLEEAGAQDDEVGSYLLFYQGHKAADHLFKVAAGLDSMVIGEDQILGQVKTAHQQALEAGTTGVYLNTFFRMAVTASKKIKTDTDLSKTSVSTATLSIKVAEDSLGSLKGKKVMVIGATGKIGGIVLMNLISMGSAEIYATTRSNKMISLKHGRQDFRTVDYEERYDYLDEMDVVISATASPHYTLTFNKMKEVLKTSKPRVFVDLAVPMDIEKKVSTIENTYYYNIDDFTRIAEENNQRKIESAEVARGMLSEYVTQFEQWMVFQKSLPIMAELKENLMNIADKKGLNKALDQFFYRVRENNKPRDLEVFFKCLK